ncbi:MAG TPA: hypothetical protein VLX56_01720 [Nitrososphaerales archaeon]|nr:hypothetical protein [Nitrososphaerales archaeon]
MTDETLEAYRSTVKSSLEAILGESAAKAILYYVGEVDPDTFEAKVRSILGEGAAIVINEVRIETGMEPHKRRWLGRGRAFLSGQRWGRGGGLSPGPPLFRYWLSRYAW